MADKPDSEERPTVAMRPLAKVERADSTRPTVEMAPLFADAAEDPDHPGRIIAGYIVDGRIGSGGMGVVYAATHPLIGKRAAIKVLSRDSVSDEQAVSRLLREARAVNAIGHPNIVDIFDMGLLDDGRAYIVMDLLVGETLRSLAQRKPLSLAEAVYILDACASVLVAAHEKRIIHRDLKPENVFVVVVPGRAAEVKLLDFGLAKRVAASGPATRIGTMLGTPTYASPEQARGKADIDERTDTYSLGVMAFELLSGKVPYKRDNVYDTLSAHIEDAIPLLRDVAPDVPASLAEIVAAMMAKTPDERPPLSAIRDVLRSLPQTAPVPVPDGTVPESGFALSSQVSEPAALRRVVETRDDRASVPSIAPRVEPEPARPRSPSARPSRPELETSSSIHEQNTVVKPLANAPAPELSMPEEASAVTEVPGHYPPELLGEVAPVAEPRSSTPVPPQLPAASSRAPTPVPEQRPHEHRRTPIPELSPPEDSTAQTVVPGQFAPDISSAATPVPEQRPHEFQRPLTPVPEQRPHEFQRPLTPIPEQRPHEFQRPLTPIPHPVPHEFPRAPTPVPGQPPHAFPRAPTPVPGHPPHAFPRAPTPLPGLPPHTVPPTNTAGQDPHAFPPTNTAGQDPHAFPRTPAPLPGLPPHAFPPTNTAGQDPHAFPPTPAPLPGLPPHAVPPTHTAGQSPHAFPRTPTPDPYNRSGRADQRYLPTESVKPLQREDPVATQPVPKQTLALSWRSILTIVAVAMLVLILIALL